MSIAQSCLCRLCGRQDKLNKNALDLELTQSLDKSNAIIIKAVDIIERELNILIDKDDKLPKYICNPCINHLLNMCSFKQKVHKTQVSFQDMLDRNEPYNQIDDSRKNLEDEYDPHYAKETKFTKGDEFTNEVNSGNLQLNIDKNDLKQTTIIKCTEQKFTEHDTNTDYNLKNYEQIKVLKKYIHTDRKKCSLLLNKMKVEKRRKSSEIWRPDHSHKLNVREVDNTDKKTCKKCGKSFGASSSLRYHMQAEHQTDKLTCTHSNCNKTFTMKALLNRHLKLHKEDRPFQCSTCDKTFKSLSNLKQHERTHSDKKIYSCELCESKFQHLSSVKTHMQIHSGDKKYSCNICEKKFYQSGNLKEHIKTHTGQKLFDCDTCNKSFTTSSQFKRHARIHTSTKTKIKDVSEIVSNQHVKRKKSVISCETIKENNIDKEKSVSAINGEIDKVKNVESQAGTAVWDIIKKAVHSVKHNQVTDKDDNQVIFITYENKPTNASTKQQTNEANTSQSQNVESSDTFRQYLDHLQSVPENQSNIHHSSSTQ